MNIKKITAVALVVLMLATAINYLAGTTITVNGRQVTGIAGYMAAYSALVLLGGLLVVVIPSAFILIAVFFIVLGVFFMLFFPLLPIAFLLLPGIVLLGIVYLIYRPAKKKGKNKGA